MSKSIRSVFTRALTLGVLAGVASSVALAAPGDNGPAKSDKVGIYEPWEVIQGRVEDRALGEKAFVRPFGGRQVLLDMDKIKLQLAGAPLESDNPFAGRAAPAVIALPKPDGSFERFEIEEYSIMEPGLAAQYPDFKTYKGTSLDSPQSEVRIDVTVLGFRAQVLSSEGSYWIDPVTMGDTTMYTSYHKRDLMRNPNWQCYFEQDPANHVTPEDQNPFTDRTATGTVRRDFRIAVAATTEYTAFFGGTVAQGLAGVVACVNRVTGVYERDFAVRLILVANNNLIIYAGADPYANAVTGAQLTVNQTTIDTQIGSANYDVGHMVCTDPGGGLAQLGVVCTTSKARGGTGLAAPTGDAFYIDYVAHELGHQFGGNHSFNSGVCAANRNAATSVEPGSGSTIMAYAGICGGDDLQSNSDPYFHSRSIDEITAHVSSRTCDVEVAIVNTIPTVNAGSTFTIPIGTPYTLTGSGSDADGDALTYCWEQRIAGSASQTAVSGNFPDVGTNPYQRSLNPATVATRQFPRNSNLIVNTLLKGETLPARTRTIPYRLTVRDGKGGQNFADVNINSTMAAGPFQVTAPNTAVSWAGLSSQTVTWNVAGTTANGVDTANVAIEFSNNGGTSFTTTILASTANDGSEVITVPNIATTQARIRVRAVGNIFFDISNANFTVTAAAAPSNPTSPAAAPSTICAGGNTSLSVAAPPAGIEIDWYTGGCGTTFVGTGNPLVVSPSSTTTYFARARRTADSAVSAGCASVAVTVNAGPVAPTSVTASADNICQYDAGTVTLNAIGGSGDTIRWFTDSCGGTLIGSGLGSFVVNSPTITTTYYARWENSCGISSCASVTVNVRSCPADFNCDQFVDDSDFVTFAEAYSLLLCSEAGMPAGCPSDLNGDTFVDDSDFVLFSDAYSALLCP
ncbi:MAG TPA: M12 family metallo-peptidase [Phycisphaerales bacterium]